MDIYKKYCIEKTDSEGRLIDFQLKYPEDFNYGYDVVDVLAEEEPEKTGLIWCNNKGEERVLSFRDIKEMSNRIANVFLGAGIMQGDRVLVVLKRHYEYWPIAVALHKIGAVLVPVSHVLTYENIGILIKLSGAKAIIAMPEEDMPDGIVRVVKTLGTSCQLWTIKDGIERFQNLTAQMQSASCKLERQETKADDPMILYFHSEINGSPKGVLHNHTYALAHIITAKYWQGAESGGLHYSVTESGCEKDFWGELYGPWLLGSSIIVYDFDTLLPDNIPEFINHYHVTSFCATPVIYRHLLRRDIPQMPSLRYASTTGNSLSIRYFEKFRKETGISIRVGYGQTETALLLGNFIGGKTADGSMGVPSPLFCLELRNRDGSLTQQGYIGEIVVRPARSGCAEGLFSGYVDSMVEERFLWRSGVYHTGDAAWQDFEGRFWFYGRMI